MAEDYTCASVWRYAVLQILQQCIFGFRREKRHDDDEGTKNDILEA